MQRTKKTVRKLIGTFLIAWGPQGPDKPRAYLTHRDDDSKTAPGKWMLR